MSASIEGAVKALLESLGTGKAAYREKAPPNTPLPYFTVSSITPAPEPSGDFGDPSGVSEVREEVDVSYWQALVDPATKERIEDYATVPTVMARIRGRVPADVLGRRCYPVVVRGTRRVPSGETNVRRDTITLHIVRQIGAPQP